MVSRAIPILVLMTLALNVKAQIKLKPDPRPGMRGKVIDSLSGQPLNYATITLFLEGEKKPVNGGTTNAKGDFSISGVGDGEYRVVIDYIGYRSHVVNNVSVTRHNVPVDLGTIAITRKAAYLKGVTITIPPKIVENRIDKIVFNAEQDLTSQGGVATDILKKVPLVSVDVDGTVELAGSSSIRFLIDGKPSSAFGDNITDVLQSIPASQIKSIEVVTNPGAKYDAQGLGGIINIILKKNTAQGVNGSLSLTGGTRLQNGSFNFNARNKEFGVHAFISGNAHFNSHNPDTYDRVSYQGDTTEYLHQDGSSVFNRHGIESGIGFDWTYRKKNSFSGSLNYNNFGHVGSGVIDQTLKTADPLDNMASDVAVLNITGHSFHFHNTDASLDYKRTFNKEDRELDISANSSFGHNEALNSNNQFLLPQDSLTYGTNSVNPERETDAEFKVDYTEPFTKKVVLGTGGKLSIYDINSSSDVASFQPYQKDFFYDSSLSNSLHYHQKVWAFYSQLSFPVGNLFDAQLGARYERTDINSYYSDAQQQFNTPGYNTLVPSIYFLRNLGKNQTLKLSYSKRIERPDYRDLNPFINTSDPKNVTSGNPGLEPEIGNRIELGYSKDMGTKGSYVISLFYRGSNHDIQEYILYYPSLIIGDSTYTNVAVTTRENIGLERNIGLSFFSNINFNSKFSIRTNIFGFYRHTINMITPGQNPSSFNYRLNLNASYQFSKTFAGEFFGNFNSPRHQAQGNYPSWTSYSLALRKQIWKKKGSIAFTAVNPFNEYVNRRLTVTGPGFSVVDFQRIPFRSFGINFNWKFGNMEFKKSKEDQMSDLNAPTNE
jgi:ferric enterobactin receptor